MMEDTEETRQAIIDGCLWMGTAGLNQGTSGNISVRVDDGFLITPSAVPYEAMTPAMICKLPLDGPPPPDQFPSVEWRFHQSVLQARADVDAVVHAHPPHATAVAIQRRPIPAIHYMVAAFGGGDIPVTGYTLFGSEHLAQLVAEAVKERHGCLMANHGALAVGDTLAKALWRMQELESHAQQLILSTQLGEPVLLSDSEIDEALASIAGYGLRPNAT